MSLRLVVVGGGAAGMSAASVAKRRDPDAHVTVLEAGGHISFSACGMPYWLGGVVEGGEDRLVVVSPEDAREKRGIDVRLHTRCVGVDPRMRTVALDGPGGAREHLPYDELVLAPGVRPRAPFPLLPGAYALRHLDDGIRIKAALDRDPPRRAAVVGGGYVGLEMAEAFVERDIPTTLIHSRATLLSDMLDPDMGEHVNQAVRDHGVDLVLEARATGLAGEARVDGVHADGATHACDLAIVSLGVEPVVEPAVTAGCALGASGALVVDDRMRTNVPHVLAAGDCVEYRHRVTGRPTFLPLALHANRAGRIAGETVTGGDARFPGVLGTAATRFFDTEVGATGLTVEAARAYGFDAVSATLTDVSKAGYMPGSGDVHCKVVVERGTGFLLGAQLVGPPGTAKHIDTAAAALWMRATWQDLEAMDLAYAPPVSPVWDPLALAARLAGRKAGQRG